VVWPILQQAEHPSGIIHHSSSPAIAGADLNEPTYGVL